jgi:hypothetical protein
MQLLRIARLANDDPSGLGQYLREQIDVLSAQIDQGEPPSRMRDRVRFAFSLSLLDDVLSAGGTSTTIDSELFVTWPDWYALEGREAARRALASVQPGRRLTWAEGKRLEPMLPSRLTGRELVDFMATAQFWLEPVNARHPSGSDYGVAFSAGLRSWTMPYRGRSGRSRRFVVVGQGSVSAGEPLVVGLIEVGDEAPFSTERDMLLRLHPNSFVEWFQSLVSRRQAATSIVETLRHFRSALLPVEGFDMSASLEAVVAAEDQLRMSATGRSQAVEGHQEKKRLAYLLRLAHGEAAFARLARGAAPDAENPTLREGIRAVHDLLVPRVHMEATVCGAIPPFNRARAGKLVASFLGHPHVLGAAKGQPGEIVQSLFSLERLGDILPDYGMLALTTKGLYPGHSALYNRAEVVGRDGLPRRLRKLGETRGESTMLLTERTARLGQVVVESARPSGRVALVYGTGGSKRMRLLESAAVECGLPKRIVHAGIRRPVYGVTFADNVPEVVWLRSQPKWAVEPSRDPHDYSAAATSAWRERWGASLENLLQEGVMEGLVSSVGVDER